MKYVLISKKGQLQILTNASQSTMPFIGINKIEMLVLPYPNIQEQGKIANIMVNIEQKIAAEESRKAALDQLFQTLLHDLMTAKIRVNHISVPVAET